MFCPVTVRYFILVIEYYNSQELRSNLTLYWNNSELVKDLFGSYIFATIGQVMCFKIIERDGPLSLSIYTGSRKLFSIVLSIIWFDKSVNMTQMIAIILGMIVMIFELLDVQQTKTDSTKKDNATKIN